ncbi:MAG: FtsX-like permease family protein [candidate division WOR-3 bacterium]
MTGFIIKGLLRDRSRSLFPFLTVAIGVALAVFGDAYLRGAQDSIFDTTARFISGHLLVTTRARAKEGPSAGNELALTDISIIKGELKKTYPDITWLERVRFGGLLDVPDSSGSTKLQVPISGLAVDLADTSPEPNLLRLKRSLVQGHLPEKPKEILLSEELARRLGIKLGDRVTLISVTMNGAMAISDFYLAGLVRFGATALDRGMMICEIADIRQVLDMEDAASEIVGFFSSLVYDDRRAVQLAKGFNARIKDEGDFAPMMQPLRDASGFGSLIDIIFSATGLILTIFIVAMAVVLWNAGLMNSLRRYGEIGIRMAMGEPKHRIYLSLLIEAFFVGLVGSIAGTLIGLGFGYYLQRHGLNIGDMMKNATMVIDDVIRARIAPQSFIIGFLPGLIATFLGSAISGLGIFRRQTAELTKELSE